MKSHIPLRVLRAYGYVICLISALAANLYGEMVIVHPAAQYQTWDGWGVSLSWWAAVVGGWSEGRRSAVADLLFDREKGLGLNVARYCIGGQDDPSHEHMRVGGDIPGYKPSRDRPYDWSDDDNQRRILKAAILRGVTITGAFSCSPPYWMTISGCSAGGKEPLHNNVEDEYHDTFADYLTEVVRRFRDEWRITFTTLEPLNEPSARYWTSGGSQQSCYFSRDKQNHLLRLVAAKLREKGLTTELSAGDETCTVHCVQSFTAYDEDVKNAIKQINTHTYNYSWDRVGPRYIADLYGKRLYMSDQVACERISPLASFTLYHENVEPGLAKVLNLRNVS